MRRKFKKAKIVIGIPSYNERESISFVVRQISEGLDSYFRDHQAIIINADNNSSDNTRDAFLTTPTPIPKIYLPTTGDIRGKGNNLYNLFCEAMRLKANAVVTVDADLRSIEPEWIKYLVNPIQRNGYDFVAPMYTRHKYDGAITNNLCYPLIYGLLGRDIRQPIGGEFAFSSRLVKYLLKQQWQKKVREYGVDIFMTTHAIFGRFKMCQGTLGVKIHKPRTTVSTMKKMFLENVGVLWDNLLANKDKWIHIKKLFHIPILGQRDLPMLRGSLEFDYNEFKILILREFESYKKTICNILPSDLCLKLKRMYRRKEIDIDAELWMKLVYELLFAYSRAGSPHKLILLKSMRLLYFWRKISFINQVRRRTLTEVERKIQEQANLFFQQRGYLVDRM
jgi:glycosyltransferase involved in cell wall biosynthesis